MQLCLIFARSRNWCIGDGGRLPWHLPEEFGHFKRTTMGCPVIMGRRTFEDHQNVLPGRTNIVLTRNPDFRGPEGLVIRDSLDAALADYTETDSDDDRSVFVIGGAGLFRDAFASADMVYETVVDTRVAGDTFLEPLSFEGWSCDIVDGREPDAKNAFAWEARRWRRGGTKDH